VRQGWQVALTPEPRVRPLHWLIGARTAGLLAALWQDPELFAGVHPIAARTVVWPAGAAPVLAPAPGYAIAATELLARLAARLPALASPEPAAWQIDTRPGDISAAAPAMRAFGTRRAWLAAARLAPAMPEDRCLMLAAGSGWLFVLPLGAGAASVQYIGVALPPEPADLLAAHPLTDGVAAVGDWSAPVAAMPRWRPDPVRIGVLAVGEAALGFDPISGDGVGHALRGLVLAATDLAAITGGGDAAAILARHAATLRSAMAQHLKACSGLYADAGAAFAGEVAAMTAGLAELE